MEFWNIDPKYRDDKYYLLAYTQGMQSNDNFEFLADFNPVAELRFVTEISGLSHSNIQPGIIAIGDFLSWKFDNGNSFDRYAVKVLKGDLEIGYVKMIHSRVFYRSLKYRPQIRIKSIDQNGKINRVFIEISYQQ